MKNYLILCFYNCEIYPSVINGFCYKIWADSSAFISFEIKAATDLMKEIKKLFNIIHAFQINFFLITSNIVVKEKNIIKNS